MKIAVIGATGFVGSLLVKELLNRGHQVTAIARNPAKLDSNNKNLVTVPADVFNTDELAKTLKGHDAIVSAYNPGWTNPNIKDDVVKGSKSIQEAVKKSGVKRFLYIGGAGSLYLPDGSQLVDSPSFPAEYKPAAAAARDYLAILKQEKDLDWTFVSPAIEMHQGTSGTRLGQYRTGLENPVFDAHNRSIISGEDLSVAIADELEHPKHIRKRFTVAY